MKQEIIYTTQVNNRIKVLSFFKYANLQGTYRQFACYVLSFLDWAKLSIFFSKFLILSLLFFSINCVEISS